MIREDAREIIDKWALQPHPEGGWYRRIIESERRVETPTGLRPAVTSIYYLLQSGDVSRPHRVLNDEIWHFLAGDDLLLAVTHSGYNRFDQVRLGASREAAARSLLVPAGEWQAARPLGRFAFLACTVAPGFDFDDFELAEQGTLADLLDQYPDFAAYTQT